MSLEAEDRAYRLDAKRKALDDEEIRRAVKVISAYEEKQERAFKRDPVFKGLRNLRPWWTWQEVGVDWRIIRSLLLAGIVEVSGGRRKHYVLKNREELRTLLKEKRKVKPIKKMVKEMLIPRDLFDVVEGFGDLKEFIKRSLKSSDPIHVLLVGPPGTAKSLILAEVEKLGGRFITAGTATKVGIRDVLFEELPRILIIDELDKITNAKDLSALLTWMESGRIVVTKHGQWEEKSGKGWVFAACNRKTSVPPELADRFEVFTIKPYSKDQYLRIAANFLVKRLGLSRHLATYVATKTSEYTSSIREAIRVAKIAKDEADVDNLVRTIRRYADATV